jgi:Cu(I)/Ag(I) efflux system periplasmic protein CusF
MTHRKTIRITLLLAAFMVGAPPATAQEKKDQAPQAAASAPAQPSDMADGEVRKIDKDAGKLTLKHGDIKNLDMPAMTMVFQVKDKAMLDTLAVGSKVKFRAEKAASGYVVTIIEAAK